MDTTVSATTIAVFRRIDLSTPVMEDDIFRSIVEVENAG
jgi:hypothetical protein